MFNPALPSIEDSRGRPRRVRLLLPCQVNNSNAYLRIIGDEQNVVTINSSSNCPGFDDTEIW